jgi:hypothetical protein
MSAVLFRSPDTARTVARERLRPEVKSTEHSRRWSPENFAQEQIRGLVRHVFFSNAQPPLRQIVLSAVEAETDVRRICRQMGEVLARETTGSVAVVGEDLRTLEHANLEAIVEDETKFAGSPLRRIATRLRNNLWLVPLAINVGVPATAASLHSYLGELRREFDYTIVAGPPAGESTEATAMAQFADGTILVLSADRTRRVAARKIKERLDEANARVLGVVLSDRAFPIPEAIYRRL